MDKHDEVLFQIEENGYRNACNVDQGVHDRHTFLQIIVTEDDNWCYEYNMESKRQAMKLCSLASPYLKKERAISRRSPRSPYQDTLGCLFRLQRHLTKNLSQKDKPSTPNSTKLF
ncbi:hypothetical protein NPIL_362601 [Nephila pilipes]|uniref:Uncharacterized protein n=1 Tax=Nephila pilipes TaxID=299642 RepID=A0A8X6P186_NEPPI|nr:hypothetical protein NPIL_362601 [Nephila pilipes]